MSSLETPLLAVEKQRDEEEPGSVSHAAGQESDEAATPVPEQKENTSLPLLAEDQATEDTPKKAGQQLFTYDKLRSWEVFFCHSRPHGCTLICWPEKLVARVKQNCGFFYLNYMLTFAVCYVMMLLVSPSALIGIMFLACCWWCATGCVQGDQTMKMAACILTLESAVMLFYLFSNIFWWSSCLAGIIVAIHACVRDASVDIKHALGDEGPEK